MAVDTLGHLLALVVTPASEQERAQVEELARKVQQVTGESVELAYVDQGYTGDEAAEAAQAHGIRLEVVKHTEAKHGFVLLPRRWVVELMPRRQRKERSNQSTLTEACCIGDGGRSSGIALQGEVPNHPTLRRSRAGVVSSREKAHHQCVRCEP